MGADRRRRAGFGRRRSPPEAPADPQAARATGISLLARRDFARRALRERLIERGYDAVAADTAIEILEDERLLDDARLVGHKVASRVARGHGPLRIRLELERAGLDRSLIDATLKVAEVDWAENARALLVRRYGSGPPADAAERASRARFLYYRGFQGDHVRSAFNALGAGGDPAEHEEPPADLALDLGDDVDL